ncbi:MAG: hypothetical protein CMB12_01535 [Euryarchaeota archaeon]|nr:hypothetical protein [Euryarchaeota archaeon]
MRRIAAALLVSLFLVHLISASVLNPDEETNPIPLEEISLISYVSSSQYLWHQNVGGSNSDNVRGMDVDDQGNIYVCGNYHQIANFGQLSTPSSSSSSSDIFVAKLSSTGDWLWVKTAGSTSSDYCYDIDVDAGGNVSITGIFLNSISFGSTSFSSSGSYDAYVAVLDTMGNWLWAQKIGASSSDYAHGVAIADSGNVYVTGYWSSGTLSFGSAGSLSCSSCYSDAYIASLDSQGNWRWSQGIGGSYYERGRGVAVDAQERVYVTGEFSYQVDFGSSSQYNYYSYDYWGFIAQYSSTGVYSWSEKFGYSSYETYPEAIDVDDGGNATICGRFYYYTEFSSNRLNAYGGSGWDMFVAQISPTGNWNWQQQGGGSSTDYCYDVDVEDATGEIAVTGYYNGASWFGQYGVNSIGSNDVFMGTLSSNGAWNWVNTHGSTSSDTGYGAAILGDETYFAFNFPTGLTINGHAVPHYGSQDFAIVVHGVDTDGDKVGDRTDRFPLDPTQWSDLDGDGYGDNWADSSLNASRMGGPGIYVDFATMPDHCPVVAGNSTRDVYGCPDSDSDGQSDSNDDFPNNGTQWSDNDGDGFGDNPDGDAYDDCPNVWGTSWKDTFGCTDLDADGWSDLADDFFNKPSQWNDTDGDGLGDNWRIDSWNSSRLSHWPGQWIAGAYLADPSPLDRDNDGYEDVELDTSIGPFDDCPDQPGDSFRDLYGCVDTDGDGWSDSFDDMPENPDQYADSDGDGYGDAPGFSDSDDCPTRLGTSTIDAIGCPDNDGDGLSNDGDECPTVFADTMNGCPDTDGDGYPDTAESGLIDDCPQDAGTSTLDLIGCPDADGDGWSDTEDAYPADATQWSDVDGDGYGDNENGTDADDCPGKSGTSTEGGLVGCEDSDSDGYADIIDGNSTIPGGWALDARLWSDGDDDGFADQQGTELSDDCPLVPGNSSLFTLGCPDTDGDGWADIVDPDDDNDGYYDVDEFADGSDPYDATSLPVDLDGDNTPDRLQQEAGLDPVIQSALSVAILAIIAIGAGMSVLIWRSSTSRRSNYEKIRTLLDEAEGFEGLMEVEKDIESISDKGGIDAGQTALLFDRLGDRRYKLEEEMRAAQQAEWWAQQQAHGQQWAEWQQQQQGWGQQQQGWDQQQQGWGQQQQGWDQQG